MKAATTTDHEDKKNWNQDKLYSQGERNSGSSSSSNNSNRIKFYSTKWIWALNLVSDFMYAIFLYYCWCCHCSHAHNFLFVKQNCFFFHVYIWFMQLQYVAYTLNQTEQFWWQHQKFAHGKHCTTHIWIWFGWEKLRHKFSSLNQLS